MTLLDKTYGMVYQGWVYLDVFPYDIIKDRDGLIMHILIEVPNDRSKMGTEIMINVDRCDGKVRLEGLYLKIINRYEWEMTEDDWYLVLEVE